MAVAYDAIVMVVRRFTQIMSESARRIRRYRLDAIRLDRVPRIVRCRQRTLRQAGYIRLDRVGTDRRTWWNMLTTPPFAAANCRDRFRRTA